MRVDAKNRTHLVSVYLSPDLVDRARDGDFTCRRIATPNNLPPLFPKPNETVEKNGNKALNVEGRLGACGRQIRVSDRNPVDWTEMDLDSHEGPRPLQITDLPTELLLHVAHYLVAQPRDLISMSLGNLSFKALYDDTLLWKRVCETHFLDGLDQPTDTEKTASWYRGQLGDFFEAYDGFVDEYLVQKPLFLRLKKQLELKSPQTLASLRPGRSIQQARRLFNESSPEPAALRLWFTFFDGQMMTDFNLRYYEYGFFGSYRTPNGRPVSLFWTPSRAFRHAISFACGVRVVLFAASYPTLSHNLALVIQTPPELKFLLNHVIDFEYAQDDGPTGRCMDHGLFTTFMRRHVEDLELGNRSTRGGQISLFPETGRGTVSTVARGLKIHMSTVPIRDDDPRGNWAFRLRIKWTKECPYPMVQLKKRWWTFRYHSGFTETDPGLPIGGSPVLSADDPVWEAVSYAVGREMPENELFQASLGSRVYPDARFDVLTWMRGKLDFVPGVVGSPLPGHEEFSSTFSWHVNWPMMLDEHFDVEEYERWQAEMAGEFDE